jgi:hypothetical protein
MFCIIIFCIIKISIKQMKHITKYLKFGHKIGWNVFLTIKNTLLLNKERNSTYHPNSMVIWIAPYVFYFTKRNVVYSNHIFVTTMRLMSKPTNFTTSSVLVLCVHVIAICCSCNYTKGWTKFKLLMRLQLTINMIFIENVDEKWTMSSNFDSIHRWMIM